MMYYNGGYGSIMPYGYGFGLIGAIIEVIWWVIIIAIIIFSFRWVIKQSHHWRKDRTPLEILKERYAKGDIDREEYEDMKKELEK